MSTFLQNMQSGPRKIAVTGHFGSGKTEFAVSLAFALSGCCSDRLALCDLDIENPYFRSRECQTSLEAAGIRVYSDPFNGRNGSELQTISAAIRTPLEDTGCRVICDCGGDNVGAMILNQFKKYFTSGDFRLLCIVNCSRPGTDTPEKAVAHIRAIEQTTGLSVTGLISNNHMIRYTEPGHVFEGWEFVKRVEEMTGIPALAACCMSSLVPKVEGHGFEVFPIGLYLRDTYLDKNV